MHADTLLLLLCPTVAQVLLMTIEQEPPSLKSYKDDRQPDGESFSRSFKEFVRLCLQKNPKKRPNCTTLLNHR
jgi:serine/threonine-protein kinase OSR1/STK39